MKKFILTLNIFILVACNHRLPNLEYVSSDIYTGGFNDFILQMESSGLLKLTVSTSLVDSNNEKGNSWNKRTRIERGRWNLINGRIDFAFKNAKSGIDSIFIGTDWSEYMNKPILIFSKDLDTAYIYGIPCILKK